MLDGMQRVRGAARVRMTRRGLADLRQQGSAKALLPRVDGPDPEVVFLNTAGGVTGGDVLDYALDLDEGVRATATTQTAERAYRASSGTGLIRTRLTAAAGAALDWLPQELIAFDGARIRRETQIDLAADAALLCVDAVVLGRAAMGETVRAAHLDDLRTIRRSGALLHQEHLALTPAVLAHGAALDGARAFATLVLCQPGCADALGPLRAALGGDGHASAWNGRLVARIAAADAAPLRRALIRCIVALRGGGDPRAARGAVPRVWQVE